MSLAGTFLFAGLFHRLMPGAASPVHESKIRFGSGRRPDSTAWVASFSSLVTTLATVAFMALGRSRQSATIRETPLTSSLETLAMFAAVGVLTWIVVRLRFPLLSLLSAIAFAFWPSAGHAALGILIFSHTLLARTRFFSTQKGRWPELFTASWSGWLTAFAVVLTLIANDQFDRHPRPLHVPLLVAAGALAFGVLAVLQRARAVATSNVPSRPRADSNEGSLGVAFAAGFATLSAGVLTLLAIAFFSGMLVAPGGSSVPNAWQQPP